MPDPHILSVPTADIMQPIAEPKRGRGRPPKIDPATGERVTPTRKPRAKAPRRPSSRRPIGPRSLRAEIGALLTLVNTAMIMSPVGTRPVQAITDPAIPLTRIGYELDAGEIDALAGALDAQCKRSPRFRRYVETFLSAGSGGALFTVVGIIAARRASRAGILPPMLDPMLGLALAGDGIGAIVNMEPAAATPTGPDPETGETPPAPMPPGFSFDDIDGGAPLGMEG